MNVRSLRPLPSGRQAADEKAKVRCRQIAAADLDAIADLLAVGFPKRSRKYFAEVLDLLSRRAPPQGCPRYGFMLESGEKPVGVLLVLASQMPDSTVRTACHAWYVTPGFKSYAAILVSKSIRRDAINLNLWPALDSLPVIEAFGFKRYCNGAFAALPALAAATGKARIRRVMDASTPEDSIPAAQLRLLRDHARFGCLSLWCETKDGGYPFIFRRRFPKALPILPVAQLIYCPSIDDLVRLARPIGKYLALRGMPVLLVPANGPIPGLMGKYFDDRSILYLGPQAPHIGDMAYTKAVL